MRQEESKPMLKAEASTWQESKPNGLVLWWICGGQITH
jgi:hypothetical protein